MRNLIYSLIFLPTIGLAQSPVADTMGTTHVIKDCTNYDGSKYKVVPKDSQNCVNAKGNDNPKPKPKPRPKPPQPKPTPRPCPKCPPGEIQVIEKEKIVNKVTYNKIRVYGLLGYGQDGMASSAKPEGEQVDRYYGLVFGGGIDYNINQTWSIGAQGLSNRSGMVSLGFSFLPASAD